MFIIGRGNNVESVPLEQLRGLVSANKMIMSDGRMHFCMDPIDLRPRNQVHYVQMAFRPQYAVQFFGDSRVILKVRPYREADDPIYASILKGNLFG